MKFTKIALAVAALVASEQAAAFDVYASGASALRDFVPLMLSKICQIDSVSTPRTAYVAGTAIGGSGAVDKDRAAFTCTLHSTSSNSAVANDLDSNIRGQVLNFYWSNEIGDAGALDNLLGGSITGIATIAPSTTGTQAKVNFINASVAGCATTSAIATITPFSTNVRACNTQSATHLTQVGISDVEPAKFATDTSLGFQNVPTNLAGNTTIPDEWMNYDVSGVTGVGMFVQAMGVVVQDAVVTAGVTNLSVDQLAGILSGAITDWRQVGSTSATAQPIKVCTRAPGSGTKATFNQLVNRAGCKANNLGFEYSVVTADGLTGSGTNIVRFADTGNGAGLREGATTGQVTACMIDGLTADKTTAAPAGTLAIGIIGLDSLAGVTGTPGYKGIAVNGVNPHVPTGATANARIDEAKIVTGQYPLWIESTAQLSTVTGAIAGADAAKVTGLFNYISAHSGDTEYTLSFPGIMTLDDFRAGTPSGTAHNATAGNMYFTRNGDTCAAAVFQ